MPDSSDKEELIKKLQELEEKQNNGRGVTAVKAIIMYMTFNDYSSARAVYDNEHDKIRNYPEIEALLQKEL